MTTLHEFKESIPAELWEPGSYLFQILQINIKGNATLEKLISEGSDNPAFVTLCHEYIHYIQNFTTLNGALKFVDYIEVASRTFSENALLMSDPKIPIEGGDADHKIGNKTYANFVKSQKLGLNNQSNGSKFVNTQNADYAMSHELLRNDYKDKDIFIGYVSIDKKLVPLNEFVISENMALIGSYLAANIPFTDFEATMNLWGYEYKAIFMLLKHIFPNHSCIKMTYIFCESALSLVPTNEKIYELLSYCNDNKDVLQGKNENDIIDSCLNQLCFEKLLKRQTGLFIKIFDSKLFIYDKYKDEIEYFKYAIYVLELMKKGVLNRLSNPISFKNRITPKYLMHYASIIKSPIIKFMDGKTTMLGENEETTINSIATFSGIMKMFFELYFNGIHECPFNAGGSLCGAEKDTCCKTDPFAMYGKPAYLGCLLNNSFNTIGIKNEKRVA